MSAVETISAGQEISPGEISLLARELQNVLLAAESNGDPVPTSMLYSAAYRLSKILGDMVHEAECRGWGEPSLNQSICVVVDAMADKLDPESFDAFTGHLEALN